MEKYIAPGMSALLLGDVYRVEHVISSLRCTAPFEPLLGQRIV
jgi:hypothetical protein